MSDRRQIPNRRKHVTQRFRIAGQRTLYVSVHDDGQPVELFLRLKGAGCDAETIALYDVMARLLSLALQYGAPMGKAAEMLYQTKFEPAGPVSGHERIKNCSSIPDLIGRYLLLEYCGREDVANVPAEATV
jgi:ribonucleoside-diphosphate reductase alpha chain